MIHIRTFRNRDLPGLFDVWMQHWQAARQSPSVTVSILERAVLSRSFFDPNQLLVAEENDRVVAWCQYFQATDTDGSESAEIASICFAGEAGLDACDKLIDEAQRRLQHEGVNWIRVGPVRDQRNGYSGLSPIGHGIGIPVSDARTASLLSRRGFSVARSVDRLVVNTATYRPPVKRTFLQLRRQTRVDARPILPTDPRIASAMNHFDIERHELIDHVKRIPLASLSLWMGDPEVQVMEPSQALISFSYLEGVGYGGQPLPSSAELAPGPDATMLTESQEFLLATIVSSLTHRQIFRVETSVDGEKTQLLKQLTDLKFEVAEQGRQWEKRLG